MANLSKPITADFNGQQIPIVQDAGEFWITGEAIGSALEYNHPRERINDIYRRHKEELDQYSVERNLRSTDGKQYKTRIYSEEGVMIITMLSKQPKASEFRQWAVKVLKSYRHGELTQAAPAAPALPPDQRVVTNDEYIHLLKTEIAYLKQQVEPKRKNFTDAEKARIQQLAAQGHGPAAIARELGRSEGGVAAYLRKLQGGAQ